MSELTLTLIRLGLLVLLWLFVFSLAAVMRRDLYGTRISRRGASLRRAAAPATPAAPARPPAGPAASPAASPAATPAPAGRRPRQRRQPTTLVVTEGSLAGTSLPLGRAGVLIGRAPECSLVLDDEFASSRHARVFPRAEGWFVEDLGSRNGTLLGGQKVVGAMPVDVGSVLRVGRTTLELQG